jgi:hypothetical protein
VQEPEDDEDYGEDYGEAAAAPVDDPPLRQPEPVAEAPAASPPVIAAHAYGDDEVSHFDPEPPFSPRRNPLKMWTWAAAIFALIAAATVVAVSYWGLPDWVPVERPTFAAGDPDLQLDFPEEDQALRRLPNGTEFFQASGRITNIGTETRSIPTILIVLRDSRNAVVFSHPVTPPQGSLAPGETVAINEAVTDVPRRARTAEFGWKPS